MYWDKARFKIRGEKVKDFIEEFMDFGPHEFVSFLEEHDEEVANAFTELQYDDEEIMDKIFNDDGEVAIDEFEIETEVPSSVVDEPVEDAADVNTEQIEYVNGRPTRFKPQVMLTSHGNPVSRIPTPDERINDDENADDPDYVWDSQREKWLLHPQTPEDATELDHLSDKGVGNIVENLITLDDYPEMQSKMDTLNAEFGGQFNVNKWEDFKKKALEAGFEKDEFEFVGDWGGVLRFEDTMDDIPEGMLPESDHR
jgi:hypothetical protein